MIMYRAILQRKNGNIINHFIKDRRKYIYISLAHSGIPIEEYTELTPDNIINKGGFSQIKLPNIKQITFEFISREVDGLHYQEI